MSVVARPLDPIGAEIVGADIDTLLHDDSIPPDVMELLERNGVLVFRRIGLDDAQQVAFSRRLGEPIARSKPGWDPEHPEVFKVSLDPQVNAKAYMKATFGWHIDGTALETPQKASLITGRVIPTSGAQTQFASTYAAYEDLTAEEKVRVEGLKVWHSAEAAHRRFDPDPTPEIVAQLRAEEPRLHPLVWTHPSGRRSLVIGVTASHVEGMPGDESHALLEELLARATDAARVYSHEWDVGDLVIWDNRGVIHRAEPYAEDSGRELHRVTLVGDEPIQ
jgi:alpha-ketoglutarate-dependent taurine dioxygenase